MLSAAGGSASNTSEHAGSISNSSSTTRSSSTGSPITTGINAMPTIGTCTAKR